jgi:endoglucanase
MELADELVARWQASAYRVGMQAKDYVWGSNAVVLNQAMMLIQAWRLQPRADTLAAAQALFDHVLGRNPGQSMVTGFGTKPPPHASNEVAINWNAPLIYVSAALQALMPQAR